VAKYLAWKSIEDEKDALNLDTFARQQAKTKRKEASKSVDARIRETYRRVMYPVQPDPTSSDLEWKTMRLQSHDPLAVRAAKKLTSEEELLVEYSATRLAMAMDQHNLWRGEDHVSLKQLWEDLARYVYLPRLKSQELVRNAVQEGVADTGWTDNFAYAEAWDSETSRYRGLRTGGIGAVTMDTESVLVRPAAAQAQLEEDRKAQEAQEAQEEDVASDRLEEDDSDSSVETSTRESSPQEESGDGPSLTKSESQAKRFHGSVDLNPERMTTDVGQIVNEVVQHLTSQYGADVQVTLEIQANLPDGVNEQLRRIVSENARTLNFTQFDFEDE